MAFGVVFVSFAVFLVPGGLVRAVAERLVFGKSAHANPDRLWLRFDLKRSVVGFHNSAHTHNLAPRTGAWQLVGRGRWRAGKVVGRPAGPSLRIKSTSQL
jgi:hypothetical protein